MSPNHVEVIELTEQPQQLSEYFKDHNRRIRMLQVTPGRRNKNPMFTGDEKVGPDTWGTFLEASVDGVPCAPYVEDGFEDGQMCLGDFWIWGNKGDTAHVKVISFNPIHPDR